MAHQAQSGTMLPASFVYPDVEAETLARDEGEVRDVRSGAAADGAWTSYLHRVLPPVASDPPGLHSVRGMVDFLRGQGIVAARDVAAALGGHGGFWDRVRRELDYGR